MFWAQVRLPYLVTAISKPRTLPGTPDDRQPSMLSLVSSPLASRNMLRVAFSGARSRKSMKVERPSAKRISMKPPPPMLPANGWVTASAKPTATAASTALPPCWSTATPTSAAVASIATTMPWRARSG